MTNNLTHMILDDNLYLDPCA